MWYSFTLLDPDDYLMLLAVGHRRGYSMIFWRHGKFAGAERHVSPEDFLDSLGTILRDAPDEITVVCDQPVKHIR
jgi:hypothetical protein